MICAPRKTLWLTRQPHRTAGQRAFSPNPPITQRDSILSVRPLTNLSSRCGVTNIKAGELGLAMLAVGAKRGAIIGQREAIPNLLLHCSFRVVHRASRCGQLRRAIERASFASRGSGLDRVTRRAPDPLTLPPPTLADPDGQGQPPGAQADVGPVAAVQDSRVGGDGEARALDKGGRGYDEGGRPRVAWVRVSVSWSRGCSSVSAFLLRRARAAGLSRHAARPGLAQTTGISGVIGGRRGGVLDVTPGSRMSW
jgi:hypothetical protein